MLQYCEDTLNECLKPVHEWLVVRLDKLIGGNEGDAASAAGGLFGGGLKDQGLPSLIASTACLVVLIWMIFGLWVSLICEKILGTFFSLHGGDADICFFLSHRAWPLS